MNENEEMKMQLIFLGGYLQGIEFRLFELSGDGFKEIQTEVCKGLRDMSLSIFKKYKVKEYTS